MAVPLIRAVGSQASGVAAIMPGLPAGTVAGDLLVMILETADEAITVSGWTELPFGSPQSVSGLVRLTIFYKIAVGGDATTTSDSGDHQIGQIIGIQDGTFDSADPFDGTGGAGIDGTPGTAVSIPGGTTSVADCLIIAATSADLPDAASASEFSGWANADLASVTERMDRTHAQGNGGGIGMATGEKASAGAYGATTATAVTTASRAYISLAVQPPQAAADFVRPTIIVPNTALHQAANW